MRTVTFQDVDKFRLQKRMKHNTVNFETQLPISRRLSYCSCRQRGICKNRTDPETTKTA